MSSDFYNTNKIIYLALIRERGIIEKNSRRCWDGRFEALRDMERDPFRMDDER